MAAQCNFILLGAGRSGTSLLAAQINHHSQVTCAMEVGAVHCLGSKPANRWRRDTPLNRMKTFAEHCQAHAHHTIKPIFGNKITTEQLLLPIPEQPVQAIENFRKYFSNTPVIFLVRDGRTCIPSKVKRGQKTLEAAIQFWKDAGVMLDFLRAHHPKLLVLRYEDLLQAPEATLKQVCTFLGVLWEPNMLHATDSDALPEMYRQAELRPEKAQVPPPEDWHAQIAAELAHLGYL